MNEKPTQEELLAYRKRATHKRAARWRFDHVLWEAGECGMVTSVGKPCLRGRTHLGPHRTTKERR